MSQLQTSFKLNRLQAAFASAALLGLAGCGGGGGTTPVAAPVAATPAPAVVTTVSVPVTVIDGALKNAVVCLDKNSNGVCDTGEPSGVTDVAGKVTLTVEAADSGKYPVLAVVGTDAIDADSGPVTTAYSLTAPASKPDVISPLTTLVHAQAESSGVTLAEAETAVRSQLGLPAAGSLFADYTQITDKSAAVAAATLVKITQTVGAALKTMEGTADASGGTITKVDIAKQIRASLLEQLPVIAALNADSSVKTACATAVNTACQAAVATQAKGYTDNFNGLTSTTIASAVGQAKQIEAAASVPATTTTAAVTASASLDWFAISGPTDWVRRAFVSTVAENTPVNGKTLFREQRSQNVAGTVSNWGYGSSPARAGDLHWNGSAWVGCAVGLQNTVDVVDAQGRSSSNYCDGVNRTNSQRTNVDIAGKKLADIVNGIKATPGTNSGPYGLAYKDWGPQDTAANINTYFGSAVFPAGSKLRYQTNVDTANAVAYDVQASNTVKVFSAEVAAGGDKRSNAAVACGDSTKRVLTDAVTLEDVIARNPGVPCVFATFTRDGASGVKLSSPDPYSYWFGTVSVGQTGSDPVATATTATSFFNNNVPIRVAFTGGSSKAMTVYECKQENIAGGSSASCSPVVTGDYTLTTLGDARILTLPAVPGKASALSYERVFVERGGKVYFGYQSKLVTSKKIRPNLEAANAIFDVLTTNRSIVGLSAIAP
jgi:trimeric autotransporter adhesin